MTGDYAFYHVTNSGVVESMFSMLWDIDDYGIMLQYPTPYSHWIGDFPDGSVSPMSSDSNWCKHEWVNTGFRKTWCKHCNQDGPS